MLPRQSRGPRKPHVCTEEGLQVRPLSSNPGPQPPLLSAGAAGLGLRTRGGTDLSAGRTPSHPLLSLGSLAISSRQLTALPRPR